MAGIGHLAYIGDSVCIRVSDL